MTAEADKYISFVYVFFTPISPWICYGCGFKNTRVIDLRIRRGGGSKVFVRLFVSDESELFIDIFVSWVVLGLPNGRWAIL